MNATMIPQSLELDLLSWAAVAGGVLGALILHRIAYFIAARIAARSEGVIDDAAVRLTRAPMALIFAVAGAQLAAPLALASGASTELLRRALSLLQIGAFAWLVIRASDVVQEVVRHRYRLDVTDNLEARRIHTQTRVLKRALVVSTLIIAMSLMLMTFPTIRQLGVTLLASAGVAGLVIGMAARPVVANLLAGLQIALAQPIRLDDVVIVDGEWGRVEEINATYVVVAIWDDRRLVVPLSHFIEKPFQNWTRKTAQLLGTVFLYVDYSVDVAGAKQELWRILEGTELWDRRAWALQVTDLGERTMQLRALMSAADSGKAFELRCHVRERLTAWLQEHHPDCLPRTRAVLQGSLDRAG